MAAEKQMTKKVMPISPGRPKGSPNRTTTLLKDAILQAATLAGGKDGLIGYLQQQAIDNPGPFLSLVGKVLPLQVSGDRDSPLIHEIVRRVVIEPARK